MNPMKAYRRPRRPTKFLTVVHAVTLPACLRRAEKTSGEDAGPPEFYLQEAG